MLDVDRVKGLAIALLWLLALTSCAPADPAPPWDSDEMARQLTSELRLSEGLRSEFTAYVLLAWRIDTRPGLPSLPRIPLPDGSGFVPTKEDRVEIALLWGRTGPESAPTGWALVQGYRHPGTETRWRRTIINRELRTPLTRLRPGEDADGTWHGYQRYDRPPSSRDACDFAAVDFFVGDPSWQRISGGFCRPGWIRAVGEGPACRFPEAIDASRR
ncbi:MAG: hypothetical protein EHM89_20215 [Acidobacteria bacterium]|nr:MAG: hypothetical protein EHM89_20215 [Acidobacteriota bacterium]